MSNVFSPSSAASRDLFDLITCEFYAYEFEGNITLPKIELLLRNGADFNVDYYDGRQEEWTALHDLVYYQQCRGRAKTDSGWHEHLETVLQLFLKYRGFEAFNEDDLDVYETYWGYECSTCEKIVHEVILKPLRARKWFYFSVAKITHHSVLFDKNLLGLIREFWYSI